MKSRLGLSLCLAVGGLMLVGTAPAAADPPCGTSGVFTPSPTTGTCAYTTVGTDTFTVPPGVISITVEALGAQGGAGCYANGGLGGLGGEAKSTLVVGGGEVLQVNVGGHGANSIWKAGNCWPGSGGFNGGGLGGSASVYGAGGGGASDVRTSPSPADRIVVGGGGGGGSLLQAGGGGGGPSGGNGGGTFFPGGTGGAGGVGGVGGSNDLPHSSWEPGGDGIASTGGPGGAAYGAGGGGGGGGYGGGAGGSGGSGDAGGGGGGGGLCPNPCSSFLTGVRSGDGQVTITYTVPTTIPAGHYGGGITVGPDQSVFLSPRAVVSGPVTVQAGGLLDIESARVSGPLTGTGSGSIRACGSTVTGPVTITGDTGQVTIGDDGSCSGNRITGPVNITGGTGTGVTFDNNTLSGPLTIIHNEGTISVGANEVSGPTTTTPNSQIREPDRGRARAHLARLSRLNQPSPRVQGWARKRRND